MALVRRRCRCRLVVGVALMNVREVSLTFRFNSKLSPAVVELASIFGSMYGVHCTHNDWGGWSSILIIPFTDECFLTHTHTDIVGVGRCNVAPTASAVFFFEGFNQLFMHDRVCICWGQSDASSTRKTTMLMVQWARNQKKQYCMATLVR